MKKYDGKKVERKEMAKIPVFLRAITLLSMSILVANIDAKPAEIDEHGVTLKMQEIMKAHVSYKKVTPTIAKRALENFIDTLDPTKTYFLEEDVEKWLDADDKELERVAKDFEDSRFPAFQDIFEKMRQAVARRDKIEKQIDKEALPTDVSANEFKDMHFCKTMDELYNRIKRLRALQIGAAAKISKDAEKLALQRLQKKREQVDEEFSGKNQKLLTQVLCTYILKAFSSSLDAHTNYFTPQEASQFLISVQQKLLGIGVQLRDDVDGFSVVKIIEGGPADREKELKVKDKIIAVNGEPVIGLDVIEVVDRIRGQDGTDVTLRVVRDVGEDGKKLQQLKDIRIKRGEVVLKESRLDYEAQPFADGAIAYFHLHAFYQDAETSSAEDIQKAFDEMKQKYKIYGVVLDLRFNPGGILSQAVSVTGLFIDKGVVVSIKDENGVVHHLRNLESKKMWDGPLVVLTNRASASAAEIVPQTLQDYGRALIVGDDHSYGKGSFQTFTLTGTNINSIDPEGEYKVTRGCYYTVSGKTPQLVGVKSNIEVPSGLETMDIGEMYAKYPLENDSIPPSFLDTFDDVPLFQREKIRYLYKTDLQKIETKYLVPLALLRKNSLVRQKENKAYQRFLNLVNGKKESDAEEFELVEKYPDFQLSETMNIMKDYIILLEKEASKEIELERRVA